MIFSSLLSHHLFAIVHFALVFVFVSHLLRQRKSPTATMSWFLAGLFLPYLALPLYVVLGSRKFQTYKPPLKPTAAFDLTDPVQRVLLASANPPARALGEVEFLDDGQLAFRRIGELIDSARSTIDFEVFIFADDETGRLLLEKLMNALRRGVRVRLLLDAVGARMPPHPSFYEFTKAGGKLAFFMPVLHRPRRGRANLRNHRKLMVVDGKRAMMGGMNVAREYMGLRPFEGRWVDLAFLLEGPIVQDFALIFGRDWNLAVEKGQMEKALQFAELPAPHGVCGQAIASGPDSAADPIYEMLLTGIYQARHRVWISTPYFVPDESLAKALELAARRGVDVRLLLPKISNHRLADWARTSYVRQILNASGRTFLLPQMIHAKATLIDDAYTLVGSANLDGRSLMLNYELGLCSYGPAPVARLAQWFTKQFSRCREGFPPPTPLEDWTNGLARLFGPLI